MTVAEVYDYGDDDTEPLTSHHMEEETHLDLPDICSKGPNYALMRGKCFLLLMALACVQLEEKHCLQNLLQLQLF